MKKSGVWKQAERSGVWSLLAIGLGLGLWAAGAPGAGAAREPGSESEGIMVAFHERAPEADRRGVLQRHGLELARGGRRFAKLRIGLAGRRRGANLRSTLSRLKAEPAVRVAEPDFRVRATVLPNDPHLGNLWGLHNTGQSGGAPDADIDAPEAWEQTTGSSQVIVAVLDTGVLATHPDLTDNILRDGQGKVVGFDFVSNDANPNDDNGHGTHVAGTIGGRGGNGIGVTGVCQQVKIMPVKFLNASGNGDISDAIEAIDFAVANGAHILNNSWGGGGQSTLLAEAILRARNAGVLFVAAAGNDSSSNDDLPTYPANYNQVYENVISVAASTDSDQLAGFSNYGAETVDIAAPGDAILSTSNSGGYVVMDGTSMATPHVSGAAALIKARFPTLNYLQIKTRLLSNADSPPGLTGETAAGRLNVNNALVVDTTLPGAPTGLNVLMRSSDALLLTWVASGDDGGGGQAEAFDLRYSASPITDANFGSAARAGTLPAPLASGGAHTYLLTGLSPNTPHHFALRSMDKVGNVSSLAVLGPVQTSSASSPTVVVSDNVEAAPQFFGSGTWAATTETAFSPTHSYTDSPGVSYLPGTDASLTLNNPVALVGFAPKLEFRLRHNLEDGYDFLYVEVSPDLGQSWQRVPVAYTGTLGTWTAKTLSLGRYYGQTIQVRFRLLADNIVHSDGAWLDDIRISGSPLQSLGGPWPPLAPGSFSASATSQTAVHLSWTDNSTDEDGFRIDRRVGAGAWSPVSTTAAGATQADDPGAAANTTYTYRIIAFNATGDAPAVTTSVTTPPFAPATPTGVAANGNAGSISVNWQGSAGAATYTLRRGTSPGGAHSVYKTGLTVPSFVDSAVTVGTAFYYTVSAVNAGGESGQSAEVSAAALAIPPPAPTNVFATRKSAKKSTLKWTQSTGSNVTKNRIYRSTSPSGPWTRLTELSATKKFTDKSPVKGTAYYYTVTAVTSAGVESLRSNSAFAQAK